MSFQIKKANRSQQKLRLGISGPSGAGKTWSSLLLASSMGAKKVCVLDTERGSASLYSDRYSFDVVELEAPYSPSRYIEALNYIASQGYDLIIADSITPEWNGKGGCLEMHSNIPGNSYTAWKSITPLHQLFIEAMLNLPCHLIVTMRAKSAYILEENEKGKMVPIKKGMEPQQRDGMEFEFTSVFEVDMNHNFLASKDRTGLFQGNVPQPLDESVGKKLVEWLGKGEIPTPKVQPMAIEVVAGTVHPRVVTAVPAEAPLAVPTEKEAVSLLVAQLTEADMGQLPTLREEWTDVQKSYKLSKNVINYVEKIFKEKEAY